MKCKHSHENLGFQKNLGFLERKLHEVVLGKFNLA